MQLKYIFVYSQIPSNYPQKIFIMKVANKNCYRLRALLRYALFVSFEFIPFPISKSFLIDYYYYQ